MTMGAFLSYIHCILYQHLHKLMKIDSSQTKWYIFKKKSTIQKHQLLCCSTNYHRKEWGNNKQPEDR